MKKNKFYYTYKITCIEEPFKDCYYYGQHTTTDLNDGYICSSKKIGKWVKKHPNGYIREIIAYYNSKDELNDAEYKLIHPHLNKEFCLNLIDGGNVRTFSNETKRKISKSQIGRTPWNKGKLLSEDHRKRLSESHKGPRPNRVGVHVHSEEVRKKMSENRKGKIAWNKNKKCSPLSAECKNKLSDALKGKNKGMHKVWDNKELNLYHFEK